MLFFCGLTLIMPSPILVETFSGLLLGISIAITLMWAPAAVTALREGAGDGWHQLNLAIMLTWFTIAVQRIWAIVYRWMDRPDWMADSHYSAFVTYLIMLAGMLYIISPGTESGQVPTKNWTVMIASVGAGGVVAGIMIGKFVLSSH